jgi:hypothetical protein
MWFLEATGLIFFRQLIMVTNKCDKNFKFPGMLDCHPSLYGLAGEVGSLSSLGCMSKSSKAKKEIKNKKNSPYLFFLDLLHKMLNSYKTYIQTCDCTIPHNSVFLSPPRHQNKKNKISLLNIFLISKKDGREKIVSALSPISYEKKG